MSPTSRSPLDDDLVAERRARVGELLRAKRIAAGLSQEALAERAGLERKTISRAETGTHAVTLDALIRIAHGLDLTESTVLAEPLETSHRRV